MATKRKLADDSRKCLVCEQVERYATTHYHHAYTESSRRFANCRPPADFGKHVCWYCGESEEAYYERCERDRDHSLWVQHDFTGWHRHTCIPPAPPGKQRCSNCHDTIDSFYDHYNDRDQGGEYTCRSRR